MALTKNNLTKGIDEDAGLSCTTASITPGASKLILASVLLHTAPTGTPSITGCSLTWVLVASVNVTAGANRLFLFRALGTNPTTGALTITVPANNGVIWIIDEVTGASANGADGSDAIVQSATATDESDTVATLTVTLGAFNSVNNATYGVAGNGLNNKTLTTPAYSPRSNQAGTVSNALGTQFRADNDTSVECTWSAAGGDMGSIGIEIRAAIVPKQLAAMGVG